MCLSASHPVLLYFSAPLSNQKVHFSFENSSRIPLSLNIPVHIFHCIVLTNRFPSAFRLASPFPLFPSTCDYTAGISLDLHAFLRPIRADSLSRIPPPKEFYLVALREQWGSIAFHSTAGIKRSSQKRFGDFAHTE